jgi:hypothetical protein
MVYANQDRFNLAIDRPMRLDLPVHKSCYRKHQSDMQQFLNSNLYEYLEKYSDEVEYGKKKAPKKRRDREKNNGKRNDYY